MRPIAIIQARMGSSRLPGKVLADIAGSPMLQHVVSRARGARTLDEVFVATSVAESDDAIADLCAEQDIGCFRGSEHDVLDRYYHAAEWADANPIVRLTADCPLLDPDVIDRVVEVFQESGADYVANILKRTYPDGLDTEVFSRLALKHAWREAESRSEREHVTPYMRNHPELFRQCNVAGQGDWSELRWTVDERADLEFVRAVYERMGTVDFGWRDVVNLLARQPRLQKINTGVEFNAGQNTSPEGDEWVD